MREPRPLLIALGVPLACSLGLLACATSSAPAAVPPAGAPSTPASALVPAEEGERWEGAYQGPYHSYLRIQRKGDEASGTWQSASGRIGEFTGTIDKHRLELAWREHDEAGNSWTGRGYFLYRGPAATRPPQIYGEWGLGENRRGNAWWAVKRSDAAKGNPTNEEGRPGDASDDRLCPGCDEVEYER
jgi:hypothetical protein